MVPFKDRPTNISSVFTDSIPAVTKGRSSRTCEIFQNWPYIQRNILLMFFHFASLATNPGC